MKKKKKLLGLENKIKLIQKINKNKVELKFLN